MAAKKKKNHLYNLTLPDVPEDLSIVQLLNYISNVNCIYELTGDRTIKVIKCLGINQDIVDSEHISLVRQLYQYMNYYHKMKLDILLDELDESVFNKMEHIRSEITRLSDVLFKYSRTLIIFKITEPAIDSAYWEAKKVWIDKIMKILIREYIDSERNSLNFNVLFSFNTAISSFTISYAYFSHIFEFILKFIDNKETNDDKRYLICISSELIKDYDKSMIIKLIDTTERDNVIQQIYDTILIKEFKDFKKVINMIQMLRYIPNKDMFNNLANKIMTLSESDYHTIHLKIDDMMFKF